MIYPKRRKSVSSGIERGPEREFPGHRQWVRGHNCRVPGCENRRIQAAHVQDAPDVPEEERGGMGMKAHDKWTVPECDEHHAESHKIGHNSFDKKHGIDRVQMARQLQARSPHRFKWLTR